MLEKAEIVKIQNDWHSKGLQGCLFATYILKRSPVKVGLETICLDVPFSKSLLVFISQQIEKKIADDDNCIIRIILPQLNSISDLIIFIEYCKNNAKWKVNERTHQNYKLIQLRFPLNYDNKSQRKVFSWVLGFAPFDFLPKTRQSPFFEIMLSTKSKEFLMNKFHRVSLTQQTPESKDRGGTIYDSHMADVFIKNITDKPKTDSNFWLNSTKRKIKILSDFGRNVYNDTNAKAKITFSYPINL